MCSVSWIAHDGGYDLFFNRDEQRSRPEARPPQVFDGPGLPYLSPVDPQAGGTWIFTNAAGITACLLNAYSLESQTPPGTLTSRGNLMKTLTTCPSLEYLENQLAQSLSSQSFAPFHLLALDTWANTTFHLWNGKQLKLHPLPQAPFFSTTSHSPKTVLPARLNQFQATTPTTASLRQLHLSPGQPADATTIKMSRDDAKTVSFTQVTVTPDCTQMHYAPRPSDGDFAPIKTLELATFPSS